MANNICTKMPLLIVYKDKTDWNKYLDELYVIYKEQLVYSAVMHCSMPVKVFTDLEYNMKQTTFNHLTTKGNNDRLYNQARCERLSWIKAMIEGLDCQQCDNYAIFPEYQNNKKRLIIWCKSSDFVVVLEQRKDVFFIITAYCVIYNNKKRELNEKYNNYLENQKRLS